MYEPALPAIEYAERSDPGRDPDKQVNEDACGKRETRLGHLAVVCDGMGGHAAGREAAELALSTIFEKVESAPDGTSAAQALKAAIEEASRRIHVMRTSEVAFGRPGSTCVAVLMHATGTEVAHVGDSRAYHVHEGQIFRVTRDHSVVQEMVDRGLLTPQQAVGHPDANRITRALGMADEVEADVRPQPVHHVAGDAFVLCSDGLSDLVQDDEILAIVGSEPAAQAVGKLIDLANARGGHDNVTVIVLRARESALGPTAPVPPTVAQTSVTLAPETVQSAAPTIVEPHGDRHTQPVVIPPAPALAPGRPLEPTPPPPSTSTVTRKRGSPAVVVGVALALVAVALLGWVLVEHMEERRGKRSPSRPLGAFSVVDPGDSGPPPAPSTTAAPMAGAPSAGPAPTPIAPLETAPPKKKHAP
jgi:serine/threonine protein phosphatase PrpC